MESFSVDIVVPVWNRPVETRNCLVQLMEHSPGARLVLLDNGSDRETERLLEEFAELLGDRALFLKNSANKGFIKAVNRGLARGEADWLAVVRNTSLVSPGWLEPMLEIAAFRPEAGVVIPRLCCGNAASGKWRAASTGVPLEADHGSFAAMLVSRSLFAVAGGFDEELGDGELCLMDFSRRALKAGFLTYAAERGEVQYLDEPPLGSVVRREEVLKRSSATYRERWGSTGSFCVYLPKSTDLDDLHQLMETLLLGARMGYSFTVLLSARLLKEQMKAEGAGRHQNIVFVELPRFFADGALRRSWARLVAEQPGIRLVAGVHGESFPGGEQAITFAVMAEMIDRCWQEKYQQG